MTHVIIYTKKNCPYCIHAKKLLDSKKVAYEEVHVDQDPQQLKIMMERSGRRTVPQIFIDDQAIGGFDDLKALEDSGQLNNLLKR